MKGEDGSLKRERFLRDTRGDAVVEATILFPIIIMIFAGLVLLSMYLPSRALLQQATQEAATAIATGKSDTWLYYNDRDMKYAWAATKKDLPNVYVSFIRGITGKGANDDALAKKIVEYYDEKSLVTLPGNLSVQYRLNNYVIYKEITVTATRSIPMPVKLTFVHFPETLEVTVSSTAVVQDGDEFVRSLDIAVDFVNYLDEKYEISKIFSSVKEAGQKIVGFLGI